MEDGLPRLSLISNGSAAIAVQTMLRKYRLPNLNVLMDVSTNKEMIEALESIGCDVYTYDLHKKALGWKEVLELTNNEKGGYYFRGCVWPHNNILWLDEL